MAGNDSDYERTNDVNFQDSELGTLRKMLQQLNAMAGATSLGVSVSLAKDSTLADVYNRLLAIRAGDSSEPVTEQDDGPAELATVTNISNQDIATAQQIAVSLGSGIKAQIRDLFVSVDTDCRVSIYSGASTLFLGNLKATNGTIQLCPRQGFTGEDDTSVYLRATATSNADITANSVSV